MSLPSLIRFSSVEFILFYAFPRNMINLLTNDIPGFYLLKWNITGLLGLGLSHTAVSNLKLIGFQSSFLLELLWSVNQHFKIFYSAIC